MKRKRKILIFSGAGVSKESGLATFRESNNSLWNNYKIEEVATISAWRNNPQPVVDFYNMRRRELESVSPNIAHEIISSLEENFDVVISTQNVDDLHEKAGSTNVIHLHGELTKLKSEFDDGIVKPFTEVLILGDMAPDGGRWRPDIVWFGENLDSNDMDQTRIAAQECDVCIIVGTSMQVSPANSIPWQTKETTIIYYVDPGDMDFYVPEYRRGFFYHIQKPATEGMIDVKKDLEEIYL